MTIITGSSGDDALVGGSTDDALYGEDGNDLLDGAAGADSLFGGGGADTLIGGGATALTADTLAGGTGDDVYEIANALDVVTEALDEGTDEVRTTLTAYALGANIETLTFTGTGAFVGTGNVLANTLRGGSGADTLDGGNGADTLIGGAGNDLYLVDDASDVITELAAEGSDEVRTTLASYTLADNLEILTAIGGGAFSGTGNDLDNRVTGGTGDDTLAGGAGNDTLDGGAGADTLIGGLGDDVYVVDNAGDMVTEATGEGIDAVRTTLASYTLGVDVEHLTYTGSGTFAGTGNDLANTITGAAGNDTLDGGAGADTLVGGTGNDLYLVDDAGDVVTELAGQGTDTVRTALASYTLADNVEILTYTGTGSFAGTGNSLANTITGGGEADSLSGGSGNDTLDGGTGADTLAGGTGNDTFLVDDAGDVVTELAGEGTDTVRTSLSSYTLGANVENLVYTGTGPFTATGNALNNSLAGGTGNDVLVGLEGNDTLNGGAGADTLTGGAGNDVYVVDNTGDALVELPGEGTDTVQSSIAYTLLNDFENLTLTGGAAISGTGNAENNALTGNGAANTLYGLDGNDTLNGGGGADTLVGGTGNDGYVVDNVNDVVIELAGEGTDTVSASVSYTLSAEVENLTLTGSGAINATGNELANVLTGNAGANTLDGGLGADTMAGGAGNDVYVVDDAGDVVTEAAGQGTDEVRTTLASYTLTANVENLTYTGSGTVAGTGNGLDNRLVGGAGADTLDGGAGTDTVSYATAAAGVTADLSTGTGDGGDALISIENLTGSAHDDALTGDGNANLLDGGAGNDALSGGGGDDTLVGGAGADTLSGGSGTDTASYAASAGAVSIDLASGTGVGGDAANDVLSGIENLTGSAGNDTLRGDGGANLLDGGAGDDVLEGRGGDDTLVGGSGTDTAVFSGNARDCMATLSGGSWTIAGADGIDTLQGVEQAQFADGLIYLDGRNNAPMLTGNLTGATDEDAAPLAVDLLQGAWDFDGNALSVTGLNQTDGPAASVSLAGGVLMLNPAQFGSLAAGQSAVLEFAFGVFDGTATAARTLSLTVAGRNDAPVVVAPLTASTDEDAVPLVVNLLQGASDVDLDDTPSVTGFAQTGGRAVTVTRVGGTLTLDPAQFNDLAVGESETVTFGYGASDGTATTAQTLSVTVHGRNDAPTLTIPGARVAYEGIASPLSGVNVADADARGPMTLTLSIGHGALTIGNTTGLTFLSGSANGSSSLNVEGTLASLQAALASLSYRATTGYTGDDQLAVTVSDDGGGVGMPLSASGSVAIAVAPGERQVNSHPTGWHASPDVTALANGGHMITWTSSNGQDGSSAGIYAQRYDAAGNAVGGEVRFNTYTTNQQDDPHLATLKDGSFVAVWQSAGQDGSYLGVVARRFAADGTPLTPEFFGTANTYDNQWHPSAAALADGGFIILYAVGAGASPALSYRFQRYDASGTRVGGEVQVSAAVPYSSFPTATVDAPFSKAVGLADGSFVIAWAGTGADGSGTSIQARRYAANGTPVGAATLVNTGTLGHQLAVSAASLADGGYILSWASEGQDGSDWGVYAQRYDAAGNAVGSEFRVNTTTAGLQSGPDVSGLVDGGFYVTWHSTGQLGGTSADIFGQRYDAAGNRVGGETLINATTAEDQYAPAIATRTDGSLAVTWVSVDTGAAGSSVQSRILVDTVAPAVSGIGREIMTSTYVPGAHSNPDVVALTGGGHMVAWTSYGGQDGASGGIYAQRYDAAGNAAGGEFRLNAYTTNQQDDPHLAVLADGSVVAVWQSAGEDGSYLGVTGRRFAADGTPLTGNFRATGSAADNQWHPSVAALADGGFVVLYAVGAGLSPNLSYRFQRFNAAGAQVGGEVQVSTAVPYSSFPGAEYTFSKVTGLADGSFVVAWAGAGADGSGTGIQARRYAANGAPIGSTMTVNTATAGNQFAVSVAGLADGGYVLSWTSDGQDGSGQGVYAQRFSAAGAAVGSEFRVNTTTAGAQASPDVVALADGGFHVTWHSVGQTGGIGYDIVGQRYDAGGNRVGGETLINVVTAYNQYSPSVAARADGTLAVAWSSAYPDGSGSSIQSRILPTVTVGGTGTDVLVGGSGPDALLGSGGGDTLTGGLGRDRFQFLDPMDGMDLITDFQAGQDRIEVVGGGFGELAVGQLDAGRFALNTTADADDRFVFNTTTGVLSYDSDGNGATAATSIAMVNVGTFSASDIWVIASV